LKLYEGMFILKPDLPEEQTAKVAEGISGEITKAGGTIVECSLSPKQRLAYQIKKHNDGCCLIVRFRIEGPAMEGLNKRLRVNPGLLRHMITVYTPPPVKPPPPPPPPPRPPPPPSRRRPPERAIPGAEERRGGGVRPPPVGGPDRGGAAGGVGRAGHHGAHSGRRGRFQWPV